MYMFAIDIMIHVANIAGRQEIGARGDAHAMTSDTSRMWKGRRGWGLTPGGTPQGPPPSAGTAETMVGTSSVRATGATSAVRDPRERVRDPYDRHTDECWARGYLDETGRRCRQLSHGPSCSSRSYMRTYRNAAIFWAVLFGIVVLSRLLGWH